MYSSLGLSLGEIIRAAESGASAIGPAVHVLEDPALPQVIQSVKELHAVEQKRPSTAVRTSTGKVPGIGLSKLVVPIKTAVMIRKNPIIGVGLVLLVLGLPFALGYALAK